MNHLMYQCVFPIFFRTGIFVGYAQYTVFISDAENLVIKRIVFAVKKILPQFPAWKRNHPKGGKGKFPIKIFGVVEPKFFCHPLLIWNHFNLIDLS